MNTNPLRKIVSLLAVALFAGGFASTASADGPMTYLPVRTAKAASKLKVGSQIAMTCTDCHTIAVSTVDGGRGYLTSFKCPTCERTFKPKTIAAGRLTGTGNYVFTDAEGHTAMLAAAR